MSPEQNDPSYTRLRLCPAEAAQPGDEVLARLTNTSGAVQSLTLARQAKTPNDCTEVTLPIQESNLRWAGFAPEGLAESKGIVLSGRSDQPTTGLLSGLAAETLDGTSVGSDPRGPRMAPLNSNLLTLTKMRPFGHEERVSAELQDGSLEVRCQAGSAPAGLVLEMTGHFLPPLPKASLHVTANHSGTFRLALQDMALDGQQDPLPIGELPQGQGRLELPEPEGRPKGAFALTLVCPQNAGEARLETLELAATDKQEPGADWQLANETSAWAWSPELWQRTDSDLIQRAGALGLDAVYISVVYEDGQLQMQEKLADFIRRARAEGIEVWAVEGDPAAVIETERPHFVDRARAIAAYNRNHQRSMQLSGVQYDIEPYLQTGYSQDPAEWLKAYRITIDSLTNVLDMPVELALPFWFVGDPQTEELFLNQLPKRISSIAIMSYRTDSKDLKPIASPFLDWGMEKGIPIRIGLEAGPIADEMRWHYKPANSGELWSVELEGRQILVLLDSAAENPRGESWRYSHRVRSPGKRQSFQGNLGAMQSLMEETAQDFRSWPSFHGFALHGVL